MARPGSLLTILSPEEWGSMRSQMEHRSYAPNESLVRQGTLEPDFQIIVDGVASVSATGPRNQRMELTRLGAGDAIGEMSLLTGEPASADITAITTVSTYALPQARVAALGEQRSRLIEALSVILASRLQQANKRLLTMHEAEIQFVVCSPHEAEPLMRLPAELARVASARVLVMAAGDQFKKSGFLDSLAGENVSVMAIGAKEVSDLRNRLHLLVHEYDQIILFGEEKTLRGLADETHAVLHVVPEEHQGEHEEGTSTVVVTDKPWTRPVIRDLSSSLDRSVLGVLPPDAPNQGAGGTVAKLARVLSGRQVGIALGAGAAKGFAHIGVLRALKELGVPIDMISGCSIGAAIAAGWAMGLSIEEIREAGKGISSRALRPTVPLHSFLSNAGIRDELKRLSGDRRFEDLQIPLAIVATDILRRSEVTFTSGIVWPTVLASMSIPGIYPPIRARNSYLVDGAVLNPVPARQARDLGAGVVIGVRLTGETTSPKEELDVRLSRPLATETITRAMEIMNNRISEISKDEADATIEICLGGGGIADFSRSDEYIEAGYKSTMEAADLIASAVPAVAGAG